MSSVPMKRFGRTVVSDGGGLSDSEGEERVEDGEGERVEWGMERLSVDVEKGEEDELRVLGDLALSNPSKDPCSLEGCSVLSVIGVVPSNPLSRLPLML